jgi:hypothetical protein
VLKSAVNAVEDSVSMKLVLANSLVKVGGINFDARTNSKIVQTLLSELDENAMRAFVDNIVLQFIYPDSVINGDEADAVAPEVQDPIDAHVMQQLKQTQIDNNRISSLECLFSLAKNQNLQCAKSYVLPLVTGLLFIAGFIDCSSKENTLGRRIQAVNEWINVAADGHINNDKTAKKRKSSVDLTNESGFRKLLVKALTTTFSPLTADDDQKLGSKKKLKESKESDMAVFLPFSESVIRFSERKLLGLFTDCSQTVAFVQSSTTGLPDKTGPVSSGAVASLLDGLPSVLDECLAFADILLQNGFSLSARLGGEDGDLDADRENELLAELKGCVSASVLCVNHIEHTLKSKDKSSKSEGLSPKCLVALKQLLGNSVFHVLASKAVEPKVRYCYYCIKMSDRSLREQAITAMIGTIDALLAGQITMAVPVDNETDDEDNADDDSDDAQEEESVQCLLLDVCIDILSNVQTNIAGASASVQQQANTHIKGIRDSVRTVFSCLSAECGDVSCVFAVVDAVTQGCDPEDSATNEGDEEGNEEDDMETNDAEAGANNKDVKINADQLMSLLTGEEDDISPAADEEVLTAEKPIERRQKPEKQNQRATKSPAISSEPNDKDSASDDSGNHDEEIDIEGWVQQDNALSKMLSLKNSSRKSGIIEAIRIQTNNRSRLLDILEVCLHNSNSSVTGHAVTYALRKLCICLKYVCTSKIVQSISEGVSFASRLMSFIQTKVCQRKFKNFSSLGQPRSSSIDKTKVEGENEDAFEDELEEFRATMTLVVSLCRHIHAGIRECAQACFGALLKSSLWIFANQRQLSDADQVDADRIEQVMAATMSPVIGIINELIDRKHTKLNVQMIDNLLSRFPHVLLLNSHVLHALLRGCVASKSVFMCLHATQSSLVGIKNLVTHGLVPENASAESSCLHISTKDLSLNVFSSLQTLLHHINSTLQSCAGTESVQSRGNAESLKRRVTDFILAGKDAALIIKSVMKSGKVRFILMFYFTASLLPRICIHVSVVGTNSHLLSVVGRCGRELGTNP